MLGHDTTNFIVTQVCRGVQQGATIRPAALRHGPTTRPAGPRHSRPARWASGSARAWLGHEVSHDTNFVSWRRGSPCVATRRPAPCDTARSAGGRDSVMIQFCIVTGGTLWVAIQRATVLRYGACASDMASPRTRHGPIRDIGFCIVTQILCRDGSGGGGGGTRRAQALRHGKTRPATWPDEATTRRPMRHYTALCSQPGFRVCTLCTRPSFDSLHCSESLF